ncbi:hypothetical protein B2J88_46330, partial [Rhodococcus sp. SRB_17]|nr:hypothetical protein [Rhodococcus sp. SRB_17]
MARRTHKFRDHRGRNPLRLHRLWLGRRHHDRDRSFGYGVARSDSLLSAGPDIANLFGTSVVAGLDVRYRTPLTHSDSPLPVTMWIE